jgi:hypothetical protein
MLIKCRNITLAVKICLLKASQSKDFTQAQESYLPALDIVQAIMNTINKVKPQNELQKLVQSQVELCEDVHR